MKIKIVSQHFEEKWNYFIDDHAWMIKYRKVYINIIIC